MRKDRTAYFQQWHLENREVRNADRLDAYNQCPEKFLKRSAEYNRNHRSKKNASNKLWREKNKWYCRVRESLWRDKNPELEKARRRRSHLKHRSKRLDSMRLYYQTHKSRWKKYAKV